MSDSITLFLCGDVMTGRGVDQILRQPCAPELHEPYMTSALGYVDLAEQANGPIARPVGSSYIWGDALGELERVRPAARIVNLETSITTCGAYEPKGINYRMNPANVGCLTAARIDCCVLANNHAMDWGIAGLLETLSALDKAKIHSVGAGSNAEHAKAPCALGLPGGRRLLIFAYGCEDSGIPRRWAAGQDTPGVSVLPDLSIRTADALCESARQAAAPDDVLIASIHWGGNWGHGIPGEQQRFAHRLIDQGGFAIVHGHSSHHAKGIEVYQGRLILYGCGDFINDYEGISSHRSDRGDLALMYVPCLAAVGGELMELRLVPFQIRRFRLNRAAGRDAAWLRESLGRACRRFGSRLGMNADCSLDVRWS